MKRPVRQSVDRRYWDSTAFLALLLPDADRVEDCRAVLDAADRGKVQIVTSAITLTEVIKLKGQPPLRRDQERKIEDFFKHSYIVIRGYDRFTAHTAREFIWKYGLKPKDAGHVATAVHARLRVLETHDGELIDLSGTVPVPGGPPLTIRKPHFSETLPLKFPTQRQGRKQEQGK